MGAATAWALSSRGADVTVYEQFEPGTERGSSHGRTRIFRLAYPDASWVELAQEALAGWRDLEQQSGREVLGLYGLVELASEPELTSRDTLAALGVEHQLLEPAVARALGVEVPPGWTALRQGDAGIVRADLAMKVGTLAGDKRCLGDQKHDPREKRRAVNIEDRLGGRRPIRK